MGGREERKGKWIDGRKEGKMERRKEERKEGREHEKLAAQFKCNANNQFGKKA